MAGGMGAAGKGSAPLVAATRQPRRETIDLSPPAECGGHPEGSTWALECCFMLPMGDDGAGSSET